MIKADLHIHTTASDGVLSPNEVVNQALTLGLKAISITDHDTINGVKDAIKISKEIEIIPGIELSSELNDEEIHILGYYIDYTSDRLKIITDKLKESRLKRLHDITNKLQKLGINISLDSIKKFIKNDYVGRPHIAMSLIENNIVTTMDEAFEKYLGEHKPAYVNRYKLPIKDSIKLIHNIGGVAVLAHPGLLNNKNNIYWAINNGIDGIEVYHSKHSFKDIKDLLNITKKFNLLVTGGSDFHGDIVKDDTKIGQSAIEYSEVTKLKEYAKKNYKINR